MTYQDESKTPADKDDIKTIKCGNIDVPKNSLVVSVEVEEGLRLLATVIVNIVCTVYIWNGQMSAGYGTAAIVFKEWILFKVNTDLSAALTQDSLRMDKYRDIICFCDTISCVALSFYEAQTQINSDLDVGYSVKIAMAVGCALFLPILVPLGWVVRKNIGDPNDQKIDEDFGDVGNQRDQIPNTGSKERMIDPEIITAFLFNSLQIAAWVLAVSVAAGTNSVEMALVAVALWKLAIFISNSPTDGPRFRKLRSLFSAMAAGLQLILMNAELRTPPVDECVARCPYPYCRVGVAVISGKVSANMNSTSKDSSGLSIPKWPKTLTLPTDRVSGWLILDKEGECAKELMLAPAQERLFVFWTVVMTFGGIIIVMGSFMKGKQLLYEWTFLDPNMNLIPQTEDINQDLETNFQETNKTPERIVSSKSLVPIEASAKGDVIYTGSA